MFRELSFEEVAVVSGGSAGSSSCDDQSGYFQSEMSSMDYYVYQQDRLDQIRDYISSQYPWLSTTVDGNDIVVNAGVPDSVYQSEFWSTPNGALYRNAFDCELNFLKAQWDANGNAGPASVFWPIAAVNSFFFFKEFDLEWVRDNMPEWYDTTINSARCGIQ